MVVALYVLFCGGSMKTILICFMLCVITGIITCTDEVNNPDTNLINTIDFPEGYVLLGQKVACGYRFADSTLFSWDEHEDAKNMAVTSFIFV